MLLVNVYIVETCQTAKLNRTTRSDWTTAALCFIHELGNIRTTVSYLKLLLNLVRDFYFYFVCERSCRYYIYNSNILFFIYTRRFINEVKTQIGNRFYTTVYDQKPGQKLNTYEVQKITITVYNILRI